MMPVAKKDDDRTKSQRKKDNKLINKIVTPKGWNSNWSSKEALSQVSHYQILHTLKNAGLR